MTVNLIRLNLKINVVIDTTIDTTNDVKSPNEEECVYGSVLTNKKHLRLEYGRKNLIYDIVSKVAILLTVGRHHFFMCSISLMRTGTKMGMASQRSILFLQIVGWHSFKTFWGYFLKKVILRE